MYSQSKRTIRDIDVLIVGAGPVGLALAGDLGWRGVSCLVIEKGDGKITQPRMDLVGIRTMEFLRKWGIVNWVESCPYPRDRRQDNVYATGLLGFELGRAPFPSMAESRPPAQSPQYRYRCPQDMFDPILARHARRYPSVSFRYNTTLTTLEQDADGVIASAVDSVDGHPITIHAKYVVGCDGANSQVASHVAAEMTGAGTLTYTTNAIVRFRELDQIHDKSEAYRWIFIGPEGTWATIVAINGIDQWRLSLIGNDEPTFASEEDIGRAFSRAVGVDRGFEIMSIMPWTRKEGVAQSYRQGRVFLAGDACHQMSPTGGFGMNTGIGDALDLAWKLEAVLSGWGGEFLLDSYEIERRPVAVRNAEEASSNLRRMLEPRRRPPPAEVFQPGTYGDACRKEYGEYFGQLVSREWHPIGIHLGYSYAHSPLCIHTGSPEGGNSPVTSYVQTTEPGGRAPHVWLRDGRSTLDWFGRRFTLVRSGDGDTGSGIALAAQESGIPLATRVCQEPAVREAYEKSLVLVRPDGHVAWRADHDIDLPTARGVWSQVTGNVTFGKSVLEGGPR